MKPTSLAIFLCGLAAAAMFATAAASDTVTITKIDGRTETYSDVDGFYVRTDSDGGRVIVIIDRNGETVATAYGVSVVSRPE